MEQPHCGGFTTGMRAQDVIQMQDGLPRCFEGFHAPRDFAEKNFALQAGDHLATQVCNPAPKPT